MYYLNRLLLLSLILLVDQPPISVAKAPTVVKTYRSPTSRTTQTRTGDPKQQAAILQQLKPLHQKLGKPKPGDWLDQHEEAGQSFREYLRSRPVTPIGKRNVIYVQPLGDFSKEQRQIVELSAEYLGLYFSRPFKILRDLPLAIIPREARRVHPQWKVKQILSTYVLNSVLKPRLPDDAAASIAFTATDLWPGRGWNFVFGQASLRNRVGVWSINRNGDPSKSKEDYRRCLRRTLKVATHETGHMFSLPHCTAYECNMCGSNQLEESDRHPLYLCPECHAKTCWATNANPIARYKRLATFCEKHGLKAEHDYFEKALQVLER